MTPLHRFAVLASLPVLLLAACAGDSEPQAATTTGTAATTGAPTGTTTGTATGTATGTSTGTAATDGGTGPACEPVGDPDSADVAVTATLDEWSISTDPVSVTAGAVAFEVTNAGEEPHELVVMRTGTPVADLPTGPDGAVDEASVDGEVIGEVEEFPAGQDCAGVLDLGPGTYALVCNIVEKDVGQIEAHYELGMRASFTVTADHTAPAG